MFRTLDSAVVKAGVYYSEVKQLGIHKQCEILKATGRTSVRREEEQKVLIRNYANWMEL